MALVTCPDCSSQVSDAAPACPKCGRPFAVVAPTPQPGKFLDPGANARSCLGVIAFLFIMAFLIVLLRIAFA